jgi:hypothetical protein
LVFKTLIFSAQSWSKIAENNGRGIDPQVCQNVTKKLSETTSSSKGTDGAAVDKRIRKTSEFALGQTFQVIAISKLMTFQVIAISKLMTMPSVVVLIMVPLMLPDMTFMLLLFPEMSLILLLLLTDMPFTYVVDAAAGYFVHAVAVAVAVDVAVGIAYR